MSYIDEKRTALLAVAYPKLSASDKSWIDEFRKKYDALFYHIIEPHFTIVFPTFAIEYDDFVYEIREKCKNFKKITFKLRCAVMNNDQLSDYYHIFLTPDEGNSDIIKMHHALYSGILRKTQRLDLDFVSHLAVGNRKDPEKCKELVDFINNQDIEIGGIIDSINIISYGNKIVQNKEEIPLE